MQERAKYYDIKMQLDLFCTTNLTTTLALKNLRELLALEFFFKYETSLNFVQISSFQNENEGVSLMSDSF